MPKAAESANAKMLIAIKPRMIDAANAYFTDSTALRIAETYYINSGKNKACKVKAQSALGIRSKPGIVLAVENRCHKRCKGAYEQNEQ